MRIVELARIQGYSLQMQVYFSKRLTKGEAELGRLKRGEPIQMSTEREQLVALDARRADAYSEQIILQEFVEVEIG